jgi:hypothetical protein
MEAELAEWMGSWMMKGEERREGREEEEEEEERRHINDKVNKMSSCFP